MKNVVVTVAMLFSILGLSACSVNTAPPQQNPVVVQQPAPANTTPTTVIVPRSY